MHFSRSERLEQAMERTGFRSSGFDYLRVALAASVLLWHAFRTSYPDVAMDGWQRVPVGLILPMFFALSGFLISGSLMRVASIREFLVLRVMRIVPALAVEIVLSMLLIGALFSTLPLGEYFTHPDTLSYLKNIYGHIHYFLPGTFQDLPQQAVNASLWTIPYELECYLAIVLLWLFRVIRSRSALIGFVVVAQLYVVLNAVLQGDVMPITRHVDGRVLVLSFLYGVALYAWRDKVILSGRYVALALVAAGFMLMDPVGTYFVGLPAAYLTVWLGLMNPRKVGLIASGDYSYGLYLYSFPIQQAIAHAMGDTRNWLISFVWTMLLAGLCAAFSWHVVEKPILKQRARIVGALDALAAKLAGLKPGQATGAP
ncbi:MAG: acyltransferase [Pseudomonadota bacterium]|nr:acyltransferase [Pseudomonadota bacterium]